MPKKTKNYVIIWRLTLVRSHRREINIVLRATLVWDHIGARSYWCETNIGARSKSMWDQHWREINIAMVAAADWLARLRNSPALIEQILVIDGERNLWLGASLSWYNRVVSDPLWWLCHCPFHIDQVLSSGWLGVNRMLIEEDSSTTRGWKVKVWEFLLHKSHQGREIKRGGEDEMTMMAFLLNWDGGLTHSIMVVNGGSAVLCHTKLFHPPTIPLRPDWEISTISSSSASFRVNNLRMTLWTDKD